MNSIHDILETNAAVLDSTGMKNGEPMMGVTGKRRRESSAASQLEMLSQSDVHFSVKKRLLNDSDAPPWLSLSADHPPLPNCGENDSCESPHKDPPRIAVVIPAGRTATQRVSNAVVCTPTMINTGLLSPGTFKASSSNYSCFNSCFKVENRRNLYGTDSGRDNVHNEFWACVSFEAGAQKADAHHPANYIKAGMINTGYRIDSRCRMRIIHCLGLIAEKAAIKKILTNSDTSNPSSFNKTLYLARSTRLRYRTLSIIGLAVSIFDRFCAILTRPDETIGRKDAKAIQKLIATVGDQELFYFFIGITSLSLSDRHEETVQTRYRVLSKCFGQILEQGKKSSYPDIYKPWVKLCNLYGNRSWDTIDYSCLSGILLKLEIIILRVLEFMISLPPPCDLLADLLNPRNASCRQVSSLPRVSLVEPKTEPALIEGHLLLRLSLLTTRTGLQFPPSVQALAAASLALYHGSMDGHVTKNGHLDLIKNVPYQGIRICEHRLMEFFLRINLVEPHSADARPRLKLGTKCPKDLELQLLAQGALKNEEEDIRAWLNEIRAAFPTVNRVCQGMISRYIKYFAKS